MSVSGPGNGGKRSPDSAGNKSRGAGRSGRRPAPRPVNYDLQSEIAYRIQDRGYVGGFLAFNNTRDYATQSVGFFVRYLFRPQPDSVTGSIGAFPRQGFRPVVIP